MYHKTHADKSLLFLIHNEKKQKQKTNGEKNHQHLTNDRNKNKILNFNAILAYITALEKNDVQLFEVVIQHLFNLTFL